MSHLGIKPQSKRDILHYAVHFHTPRKYSSNNLNPVFQIHFQTDNPKAGSLFSFLTLGSQNVTLSFPLPNKADIALQNLSFFFAKPR